MCCICAALVRKSYGISVKALSPANPAFIRVRWLFDSRRFTPVLRLKTNFESGASASSATPAAGTMATYKARHTQSSISFHHPTRGAPRSPRSAALDHTHPAQGSRRFLRPPPGIVCGRERQRAVKMTTSPSQIVRPPTKRRSHREGSRSMWRRGSFGSSDRRTERCLRRDQGSSSAEW